MTTRYEEQYKAIKAPMAFAKYGLDLFGDTVNLYNGGLTFAQTDVSLPGNNALRVEVGRRLKPDSKLLGGRQFGRWEMDIPHLHGIFVWGCTEFCVNGFSFSSATSGHRTGW